MMWELITHPSNLIFSISICLVFLLGIVECLLLIAGSSSQGILEQFVPDHAHPDFEVNPDHGLVIRLLDWLYIGRIPILVWLIIFLTVYGLFGLISQMLIAKLTTGFLPIWIIAPGCLVLCMPLVRFSSAIISKIIPKDETTAIHAQDLIGRKAIIILGEAKPNSPAEAKVQDQFGQIHYILVEPELDIIFKQGQEVLLTQKTTLGFQAIEV
ncbi:YqiJ family protein [Acinetobacter stercoris]|nr:YqiJ family protein [Acinetobacter stercoris]